MIYLLTYFLLEYFEAPSIYFTLFWGVIIGEVLMAVINGMLEGIRKAQDEQH
jgi:hypothetical protein